MSEKDKKPPAHEVLTAAIESEFGLITERNTVPAAKITIFCDVLRKMHIPEDARSSIVDRLRVFVKRRGCPSELVRLLKILAPAAPAPAAAPQPD